MNIYGDAVTEDMRQQTPSNAPSGYGIYYWFDQIGDLTAITYPDGRFVTNQYNTAAQLIQSTFASFNGTNVGYNYLSNEVYTPPGAPTSVALGNGIADTMLYNNVLEPTSHTMIDGSTTDLSRGYNFYPNGMAENFNDNLGPQRNQSFTYDDFSRVASAQSAATSGSDCWGESFGYDQFSNLLAANATKCSVPSWNQSANANNQILSYGYDAAGNLIYDGVNNYQYDAEGRLININSGAATYVYDAQGLRAAKTASGQTTSYIYAGGQVLAELASNNVDWDDYIYGSGQLLAKASSYIYRLHTHGVRCGSCGWQWISFNLSNSWNNGNEYTIQSGDKIYLRQYQAGTAQGGLVLFFSDGTASAWDVNDNNGQPLNSASTQNAWLFRVADLSAFAGKTVSSISLMTDADTQAGTWDEYYEDISLVSQDGTVHPIYASGTTDNVTGITDGDGDTSVVHEVQYYSGEEVDTLETTYFYGQDSLGSVRLMTAVGGWPVWSGTYLPFGYEWNPQATTNTVKFTGMERDSQPGETGLDHTWFRQYNSAMGRWMTPDPAGMAAADPTNPQSWNRYAYVENNPLSGIDPSGLKTIPYSWYISAMEAFGGSWSCEWDNVDTPCTFVYSGLTSGAAVACPNNDCAGYGSTWKLSPTGEDYMLLVSSTLNVETNLNWDINDPNSMAGTYDKGVGWADLGPIPDYWDFSYMPLILQRAQMMLRPNQPKLVRHLQRFWQKPGCGFALGELGVGLVGTALTTGAVIAAFYLGPEVLEGVEGLDTLTHVAPVGIPGLILTWQGARGTYNNCIE